MIITPLVSDWSVLEGQIIDITVDRLFDRFANRQASPVTWSTFVRRNELSWFTEEGLQQLEVIKKSGESYAFTITLVNKGGKQQPFSIQNIPPWLKTTASSGVMEPNSVRKITFTVEPDLTIGRYELDLFLDSDFNFDEKLLLNLRVIGEGPAWVVNPADFENSMSIIGKVKINGVFTSDAYSMLGAFSGDQVRGVARPEYDENYDEYFVYLPVYSNASSGEQITFKIWDAATGKIYSAQVNGESELTFIKNEVYGYKSAPYIFESTNFIEQYLTLQKGWTWFSVYAGDSRLNNLNALTTELELSQNDLIKSSTDGFDIYDRSIGWSGSLSTSGGLKSGGMYKIRLGESGNLAFKGSELNARDFSLTIQPGWNWLSYPLSGNINVKEGLAFLDAKEGDVIKSQRQFAVYDPRIGWSGTLKFLISGDGYMLKSNATTNQNFVYPDVFVEYGAGRQSETYETPVTGIENWSAYESSMNVVAEYPEDGEQPVSISVMDESGNIRGKADFEVISGRTLAFITIHGKSVGDELLRLFISGSDGQWLAQNELKYTAESLIGTFRDPLKLKLRKEQLLVYPNPVEDDLNVLFTAEHSGPAVITLTDLYGRPVHSVSMHALRGSNLWRLSTQLPRGVFMLRIEHDGGLSTIKVIKQ
jgi:hypothetical protein